MVTLTVLMGPPGAGKTTWTEANRTPGQVICSTERIRTDPSLLARPKALISYLAALRAKADRSLREGRDVVVDGCNTRKGDRSTWLGVARGVGRCTTRLVVFHTPLSEVLRVQVERGNGGVPEYKMREYHDEYLRALRVIPSEGWGGITHVRRGSAQPKRVSNW